MSARGRRIQVQELHRREIERKMRGGTIDFIASAWIRNESGSLAFSIQIDFELKMISRACGRSHYYVVASERCDRGNY